jgi:hypothetical protein
MYFLRKKLVEDIKIGRVFNMEFYEFRPRGENARLFVGTLTNGIKFDALPKLITNIVS